MAKQRKKVIVVIVEGACDEALLAETLDELVNPEKAHIEPFRGDIMNDPKQRNKSIKEVIGTFLTNKLRDNKKFSRKDVLGVLHIIDTDGFSISPADIRIDQNQDQETFYNLNNISVHSSDQASYIEERNIKKRKNVETMFSTNKILSEKIPYQVFYFSRHMEHVIFDDANPIQERKAVAIDDFIDELSIPLEDYLQTYSVPLSCQLYEEKYKESWEFLKQGTNSLKRCTNINLMFEYIRMLLNR